NAERFTDQHLSRLRYCWAKGDWLAWTGTHWADDATGDVHRRAAETARSIYREAADASDSDRRERLGKWAIASESRSRLDAMIALARAADGIAIGADELDRQDWLFNCQNVAIDLKTGRPRDHNPADLITRCAPVKFDPAATAPIFHGFLRRIFSEDDELITFVQRVLGMCLTGDVREQFLFICHGQGANGKSVLLDTIAGIMGDYCGAAAPDLLVAKKHGEHPTELADLQGRRLVVASETEAGAAWRLQLIKRLTGDATIKARKMRQDFYEFARTHKLLVVTNSKPRVVEDSEAVWRRMRLIPFSVVIPPDERDPHLLDRLKAEASGILNWLVEGCGAWQVGGLQTPPAVLAATAEYRDESDPLKDFISDRCELDPEAQILTAELRRAYEAHCEENGAKPLGKMRFAEALGRHGCHGGKNWQGRIWKGVTLSDSATMTTHDD
ncbi:MAG: phage/plasmid primase, P4 family, partial [Phycisphaeraceae bacterium]